MGAQDYAGSGVVHAVGGFVALAGAFVVGPRLGKFVGGRAQELPAHSTPFVVVGTFILFFGWFGFNINTGGSIGLNAVNTLLAGATGAVVALYITLIAKGKADILMACNGALAGLVGITAPVAFVDPWAAVVIGAIAAPIMYGSVKFIENVLKVDDPVGAISVHGVTGLWGLLAVAIFANNPTDEVVGLVGGSAALLLPQIASIVAVVVWSLVTGIALFYLLKFTMGVRVSEAEEMEGLDIAEHGIRTYPGIRCHELTNAPTNRDILSPLRGPGLWPPPAPVFPHSYPLSRTVIASAAWQSRSRSDRRCPNEIATSLRSSQ